MVKGFLPKFTLPDRESDDRHGDGVAMRCDGVTMLIDGFEGGEPTNGLKRWLSGGSVSDIDIAVLTHGHYDHYNGLKLIEDDSRFHIKTLYCYDPESLRHGVDNSANGRAVKSDINNMYNFINYMKSKGTDVKYIDKGGTIKFGDITWKVFRKQPTSFTDLDGGEGYAFLNDGSLVLYSPEIRCIFGGDGPGALKDAIAYFNDKVVFYDGVMLMRLRMPDVFSLGRVALRGVVLALPNGLPTDLVESSNRVSRYGNSMRMSTSTLVATKSHLLRTARLLLLRFHTRVLLPRHG